MNNSYRLKKKKGFTLIEIAVALVIVVIVASLAMVGYKRSVERAKSGEP